MSIWFTLWLGLAGLVAFVWFVRAGAMGPALRQRQVLRSDSYDGPPSEPPHISVLVAAKDEEDNIEACLTGLLDQDYPDYEVIAVDDRSTDATLEIMRRLERRAGGQLRVLTVQALRDGWFGKNNAMRVGVEVASGDWLCFTDADCTYTSRSALSMAMREALTHRADFLSVTPVLETTTIWEKILQPVCALVLIFWFLPKRVNDPSRKTAYANGAFMLMRRSLYDAIGGHERVRTEVNEDVQMARLAKQAGMRLRVVENDDLYRVRMYRTLPEAWRGWSRIFYGCLRTLPRLGVAALLIVLFTLSPWISLLGALAARATAGPADAGAWSLAAAIWAAAVLFEQIVIWRFYGIVRIARPWSLAYALAAATVLGMLVNAMFKSVGATATTWRDTTYRRQRLEATPATVPCPAPAAPRSLPTKTCLRADLEPEMEKRESPQLPLPTKRVFDKCSGFSRRQG